jgi:hypothetical protein
MESALVDVGASQTSRDLRPLSVKLYAGHEGKVEPPTPAVVTRTVPEVPH